MPSSTTAGFTIVDDRKVEPADLGNNFFIEAAALGGSRERCVTELLKELNEAVEGSFVEEAPSALLDASADFFRQFTLVVATQVGLYNTATMHTI